MALPRRIRFSLRSLLLTVLTLAAAATLWQNAAPWRIERQFDLESTSDSVAPGRANHLVFSPDGKWFHADFFGVSNNVAYLKSILWNIESGQRTVLIDDTWKDQEDSFQYYFSAFSDDSRLLLAGVSRKNHTCLMMWDMKTQSQRILSGPPVESVQSAYFHPNSREIVFRLKDRSELIVDVQTNLTRRKFENAASLLKLSRSGDRIAWIDTDESIHILDAATLHELHRIEPNPDWRYQSIRHLSASTLYVDVDWTEQRLDFLTPQPTLRIDLSNPAPAEFIPRELVSVSPDESLAVFTDTEEKRIVDMRNQSEIARYSSGELGFTRLTWFDDNKHFYSSISRSVYETATGRIVFTLPIAYNDLSPDGSRMISRKIDRSNGNDSEITTVYDMLTGEPLHRWKSREIIRVTFAPNSRSFISHRYDSLHLWTRYRPEPWWGLVCLPEFWLLLIFTSTLLWNLRRDRRPSL